MSREEKSKIIRPLIKKGLKNKEIAECTGIPLGTVNGLSGPIRKELKNPVKAEMIKSGDNSDRHKCRTYKKVKEYLVQKGYHAVPVETYDHIDEWLEWYQNDVEKFHHYKLYNGAVMTNQERYKLGMAKTVCEDWANLLLNEKVSIKAGKYSERLSKILRYNNFSKQGNQLIEKAFALGTGAFVEYKDANDRVIIDYIRADMIYPLSWDNGDVTECAFGTSRISRRRYRELLRERSESRSENA